MKVIALLISLSLFLALCFLATFYYALKKGQFDDLESPAFRFINQEKIKKKKIIICKKRFLITTIKLSETLP